MFNKSLTLDKHTQTNKIQIFDTCTQTSTKELFKANDLEIDTQYNKLVFTKNISTQTELATPVVPRIVDQAVTSKANGVSSNYLDNKLNDLLRHSFNNYTNRHSTTLHSPLKTSNTNVKVFKFHSKAPNIKQISNDNLTLKALNQNFSSSLASSTSNKRPRISDSLFELDDLEENDSKNFNENF